MAMNGDSRRPYEEGAYFVVQSGHLFRESPDARRKIIKHDMKSDTNGLSVNHGTISNKVDFTVTKPVKIT